MNEAPEVTLPTVILFSSDLMLISSAGGAAANAGFAFASVTSVADVLKKSERSPVILCLDLAAAEGSPDAIAKSVSIQTLKSAIAFGPHVHTAKLDAARQAGFGRVLSRGQFVSRLLEEISASAARLRTGI